MIKQILLLIGPTVMLIIGLPILQNVIIAFILFYSWLLFVPIAVTYWERDRNYKLQLCYSMKSITIGMVSGIVCLGAIYFFGTVWQSAFVDITDLENLLAEWNFTGRKVLLLIIVLIFINPISEEFYWREYIVQRLSKKFGYIIKILVASFFYSLYHWIIVAEIFLFPYNVFAWISIFLAGTMWGIFRYKFQSLTASIISHCLADMGIMLVYWNIIVQ